LSAQERTAADVVHGEHRPLALDQLLRSGIRRALLRFSVAFAASTALTVLWAFPLVLHLGSRVLGGPSDSTSTIRDYWSMEQVGKTPFTATHDSLITAPEGIDLSPGVQVANAFQPAAVWALKDVAGLVGAWNIFILGGIVLTAACTWLLLDFVGVGVIAAFFGAYAFAFNGYLINKAYAGHGGLVHAWVFPLILLALLRWRASGNLRWPVAAGALTGLAFYVHTYYGVMAALIFAVFFVVDAVGRRNTIGWKKALHGVLSGCLAAAVVVAPALVATRVMSGEPTSANVLSVASTRQLTTRLIAYIAPTHRSPLGALVPNGVERNLDLSGEPSLFFGFSTIILAAAFIWQHVRGRRTHRFLSTFCLALVVAAFGMSLPRLTAIGPVHVPAPSWLLGQLTGSIRVYSRFGLLAGLGLAILAALMVDRIARRRPIVAVAFAAVLVLELTPSIPAKTWIANDPPPADRWLADHPGGIVAIYPLPGNSLTTLFLNGREYYFQRFHGHPLFSQLAAGSTPLATALRHSAQTFDDPDTSGILAAEHVRYVVVRDDVYRALRMPVPAPDASSFRLLARVRGARIFRVTSKPLDLTQYVADKAVTLAARAGQTPPSDSFVSGFYNAEKFKYGKSWRWMYGDGRIQVTPSAGITHLQLRALAFSATTTRTVTLLGEHHKVLGTQQVGTAMTPVTFGPFAVRGGSTITFTLVATPGPTALGGSDPRMASIYISEPVFQPVLAPESWGSSAR
jgi:hypothetical protein